MAQLLALTNMHQMMSLVADNVLVLVEVAVTHDWTETFEGEESEVS
jgi:hypothetical protein